MFSKLELKLLDFHVSNLEYACGANLSKVSALNWDQNEQFPQFQGEHTIMTHGFSDILENLANDIKVHYSQPVTKITDKNDKVEVETRSGQSFTGDRCLVTVPLALLKKSAITFEPPLCNEKIEAINRLGKGLKTFLNLLDFTLEFFKELEKCRLHYVVNFTIVFKQF